MDVIAEPAALRERCRQWRREGRTIGLVPTMGNLHAGHHSLMRRAAADCDCAVATLFVNPLQFGAGEDFAAYPRTFEDDRAGAEAAGIDLLFAPPKDAMYPPGFATSVEVAGLTEGLCGRSRPGHFRGVTTVVLKLLCLTVPDRAYFGEKDYQQFVVIRRMVEDMGLGTEIVPMPIIREADGLAMSSRNRYLNPAERRAALCLSRALAEAQAAALAGETGGAALCALARTVIAAEPLASVDYVELVDPETLAPLETLTRTGRMAVAVRLGPARLIDNAAIHPAESGITARGAAV